MTRARLVLGSEALRTRFDAVREAVISAPRDAAALRQEIVAMRERVRQANPVRSDKFDVKHSPGGMVDAEFAVQYVVLSQSGAHPQLLGNVGNIALLQRAAEAGLLPAGVGNSGLPPTAQRAAQSAAGRGLARSRAGHTSARTQRRAGAVGGGVWRWRADRRAAVMRLHCAALESRVCPWRAGDSLWRRAPIIPAPL